MRHELTYLPSASCKAPHSISYTDEQHSPLSLRDLYDMGMALHHLSVGQENGIHENFDAMLTFLQTGRLSLYITSGGYSHTID